jgi:hypothetical protein
LNRACIFHCFCQRMVSHIYTLLTALVVLCSFSVIFSILLWKLETCQHQCNKWEEYIRCTSLKDKQVKKCQDTYGWHVTKKEPNEQYNSARSYPNSCIFLCLMRWCLQQSINRTVQNRQFPVRTVELNHLLFENSLLSQFFLLMEPTTCTVTELKISYTRQQRKLQVSKWGSWRYSKIHAHTPETTTLLLCMQERTDEENRILQYFSIWKKVCKTATDISSSNLRCRTSPRQIFVCVWNKKRKFKEIYVEEQQLH